jgi:hypothetical protein
MTSTHPEERRIAGLLQEMISRSGVAVPQLEESLGWQPGRLVEALDGERGLAFGELVQVLPLLRLSPADFFARAYGLHEGGIPESGPAEGEDVLERRFEESRRVIEEAIVRRTAWLREHRER